MEIIQHAVLPVTVVGIILFGLIKKVPVFECFTEGARDGLKILVNILPSLTALMVAVKMLVSSGALTFLSDALSGAAGKIGIPAEVLPLCMICPLSGSGAISVLTEIFEAYGPDSLIGRTASVICGASETTFYAITVYFGSVGITKTGLTLPCSLAADFTSYVCAAFFCR